MYEINKFSYSVNGNGHYLDSLQYGSVNNLNDFIYPPASEKDYTQDIADDDIDQIFKENLQFKKLSTLQLLYLIHERETLRDKNISSINSQITGCTGNLSKLYMAHRYLTQSPIHLRRIDGLQKLISDLERQSREEKVSSWKDTLSLKLSVLDKLKEYKSLKRQEGLFGDVA